MNIPRNILSGQLREEQKRTIINTSPAEPEEASVTRACRWAAFIAVVGLVLIVLANQVIGHGNFVEVTQ